MSLQVIFLLFISSSILSFILSKRCFKREAGRLGRSQDSHIGLTSRLGGLAISLPIIIYFFAFGDYESVGYTITQRIVLLGSIVALIGLLDDLYGDISARFRLLAMSPVFIIAALWIAPLDHLDIAWLDGLLANSPVFVIFITVFAGVGVTNGFNLIDGMNGLAGLTSVIALVVFGFLAIEMGDMNLLNLCISVAVCCLGFLIYNFPKGRLFLGDCGAYFLGFMIAQCAIYINVNHGHVSSWFFLVICLYPVWETLFSIIRRLKSFGFLQADRGHLHQLIHDYISLRIFSRIKMDNYYANALTGMLCSVVTLTAVTLGWIFKERTSVLLILVLGYVVLYLIVHSFLKSQLQKARRLP